MHNKTLVPMALDHGIGNAALKVARAAIEDSKAKLQARVKDVSDVTALITKGLSWRSISARRTPCVLCRSCFTDLSLTPLNPSQRSAP